MNKIKWVILLTWTFVCFYKGIAQQPVLFPLQKGDTLPDLEVSISTGDTMNTGHLSEYKGKLLLLDFWATYCSSCIQSLPHMLQLQREFGDKIKILIVTQNKDEEIQRLWKRLERNLSAKEWKEAAKHLSFIKQDSILHLLFPHKSIPTHVWIDKNQIVKAIAYSSTTNSENILNVLSGKSVKLDELRYLNLDMGNPLLWFSDDNIPFERIQYYSFLINHLEFGAGSFNISRTTVDTNSLKNTGVICINNSIIDLYRWAYKNELDIKPTIPMNRIIIGTSNRQRFVSPQDPNKFPMWAESNTYCYALKTPPAFSNEIFSIMRSDLNRIFYLKSGIEKRRIKCLVLKRITSTDKIHTQGLIETFESKEGKLVIRNMEMNQLFLSLSTVIEAKFPELLFFNESNYNKNIDIEIPWKTKLNENSLSQLKKSLRQFGLDLVYEYKDVEMLVISEKGSFYQ